MCEGCDHAIRTGGIGYLTVDVLAAVERGKAWENGDRKAPIPWRIYHQDHDPNAGKWNHVDHRIWACRIETTEETILAAMELMYEKEWVCDTNLFPATIHRILADSASYNDIVKLEREANRQKMRAKENAKEASVKVG